MSDQDILVSRGSCYTAAGKKLDESFIPCGNDAFGHQTCCGAGDNCLADRACFGIHGSGYGSFLTYWAGCSDAEYKDASCPDKQVDQPWVALTLCDDSDGEWAICSQEGDPSTLRPGSFCSCTDAAKATVAFKDSTSLNDVASLPQSTGQTISFFNGQTPTGSPTASSSNGGSDASPAPSSGETGGLSSETVTSRRTSETSTPETGTVRITTSETETYTSSSPPSTSSSSNTSGSGNNGNNESDAEPTQSAGGLSAGDKISIGVGVGVGFVLLVAACIVLFVHLRRRRRQQREPHLDGPEQPKRYSTIKHPTVPEVDGQPRVETAGRPAQPWTLRSELEGTKVAPGGAPVLDAGGGDGRSFGRADGGLHHVSELPGSESFQQQRGDGSGGFPSHGLDRGPVPTTRQGPEAPPPRGGDFIVSP